MNSSSEILVFNVGNKIDLEIERIITKEEGEKYFNENKYKFYIEA